MYAELISETVSNFYFYFLQCWNVFVTIFVLWTEYVVTDEKSELLMNLF